MYDECADNRLIHHCLKHHEDCRVEQPIQLPTRLLDIITEDEHQIRLVETERLSPFAPYVALSHTWGHPSMTGSFLTTKLGNIQDRREGIHLSALPQNFQDTVKVAHVLGVRYVWIDSLCIIQDSPTDWAREASTMGQVYAGGYITIVATSATSAHDGFLKRSPSSSKPAKIPYHPLSDRPSSGFFYVTPRYTNWHRTDLNDLVEETVWNNRGWTFGERLLLKRLLHFTGKMLYFECRAWDWMEDNRPRAAFHTGTRWLLPETIADTLHQRRDIEEMDRIYNTWYQNIEKYSARHLTKASDKLPAVAGIAQQMAKLIDDEYLAGLWRNDLIRGLLWSTMHSGATRESEVDRAPSWSWARFDGEVLFDFANAVIRPIFSCVEVLEAKAEMSSEGTILAWLKLRGKIERISIIQHRGIEYSRWKHSHDVLDGAGWLGMGNLDQADV